MQEHENGKTATVPEFIIHLYYAFIIHYIGLLYVYTVTLHWQRKLSTRRKISCGSLSLQLKKMHSQSIRMEYSTVWK